MERDIRQQVCEFIDPFRTPASWWRRKPLSLSFSLRKGLHLSADEFDYLMNDYFLRFKVDALHYNHLAYFPDDSRPRALQALICLGRYVGYSPKLQPLTLGLMVEAASAGQWPCADGCPKVN